ncbi:MAG: type II toxin-antitoxin system VapC family toxin [Thiohalomonadales bacterium]
MYILDTNTVIYYFKNMGNVANNLLATSPKDIAIPTVVLYELEYGIAKSTSPKKRMRQLAELSSVVEVLDFGQKEALTAARIRASLEKKGTPIGPYDIMIAGTTICNQGILITNNSKEFTRVPNLKLENWY